MTTDTVQPAPDGMRLLNEAELDDVNGGLLWLAAGLIGFAMGAAIGAVARGH